MWDGESIGDWAMDLPKFDCVLNLSGRSISTKFTNENLKEILSSRVKSTEVIGEALQKFAPQCFWINASAIGFYGNRGDELLTELSTAGVGDLASICAQWEESCQRFQDLNTAIVRIGIVLDTEGGALKPLNTLTHLGLGGAAGSGEQYMSWIHAEDLARMFLWIADERRVGIFNGTAPNPVRNKEFMRSMRYLVALKPFKSIYSRIAPPAPAFLLNIIGKLVGPDAQLLLNSQRVQPASALNQGFEFQHAELEPALVSLLKK